MSKKKNETHEPEVVQQEQKADVNTTLDELMAKGSVTLMAATREELQAKALTLIEQSEGKAYAAGAAAYDADNGIHVITIIRKEA